MIAIRAPRSLVSPLRRYSTSSWNTLVTKEDHDAPHLGVIRNLTLHRPEARNAISTTLLRSLSDHIRQVEHDIHNKSSPVRCLIISSALESCFCAGADLKERAHMNSEQTANFLGSLRTTLRRISELSIPSISAVSSVALGGGLELALSTRFRVFASTAIVGLPETRLGIIPGAGGTYRLGQLIGKTRAQELILTGRRVSGKESLALGLCNRLVRVDDGTHFGEGTARQLVLDEAIQFAKLICEGGPVGLRAAMRAVDGGTEESENEQYETVLGTQDRLEALTAFREKRKPIFTGR